MKGKTKAFLVITVGVLVILGSLGYAYHLQNTFTEETVPCYDEYHSEIIGLECKTVGPSGTLVILIMFAGLLILMAGVIKYLMEETVYGI